MKGGGSRLVTLLLFCCWFKQKFIYIHENMENKIKIIKIKIILNCKSITQAELIVIAHKHNLLNSFCNNGYVYVKQHENDRKISPPRK